MKISTILDLIQDEHLDKLTIKQFRTILSTMIINEDEDEKSTEELTEEDISKHII